MKPAIGFPWSLVAATALAWLIAGCADERVAGGGTETGNAGAVSGRILDSDGHGLASALVDLEEVKTRSDGSEPGSRHATRTDGEGRYRFDSVQAGKYALYAPASDGFAQAAILTRLEKRDSLLSLPDAVSRRTVTLTGRVLPPVAGDSAGAQVCVPGMRACVSPGADGVWRIQQAPRGAYEILFLTGTSAHYLAVQVGAEADTAVYVRDVFLIDSAGPSRIPYRFYDLPQPLSFSMVPQTYPAGQEPAWYAGKSFADVKYFLLTDSGTGSVWNPDYLAGWKYARTLDGDSLYTGADLAQPLSGFPVPIRLTAANFDFSQARPDGGDLAFSDAAGHLLPFETERWDAAGKRAEIWVRVDTLAAANSERMLRMHWGNPAAPYRSDATQVFLAADGVLDAWHFNEEPSIAFVPDARGLFAGVVAGPPSAGGYPSLRTPEGVVGPALALGKSGDYVHVPWRAALDVSTAFTVSIWARLDQPDNGRKQLLASKWQTARREWHLDIYSDRTFEIEFGDAAGNIQGNWRSTAPVPSPGAWHQYAAVYDKGAVTLYLDGLEAAGALASGSIPAAVNQFNADVNIGSNSIDTTLNLQGNLDECRIYSTAKSGDWMNMDYRTQKTRP